MSFSNGITRRDFVGTLAAAGGSAFLGHGAATAVTSDKGSFKGPLCFFSKHLPDAGWREMARLVRETGFDGVDLTVRRAGHVLPERAAEDLPRAVEEVRAEGLPVPMITTELLSAEQPAAQPILSAAGRLGIPYFKPGYYHYAFEDVLGELDKVSRDFRGLAALAQKHGVRAGFHNHAAYVGAPVWDIARILEPLDPKWAGYYFDIRHAVAEGGGGAWKIAATLVAKRIMMIAVKDFYWEKTLSRGWRERNCPLGEGMVDWKQYFALLAKTGFHGPVSVHLEYAIPGASAAARQENTLIAARKDLDFLRAGIREAYSGGAAAD